MPPKKPIKKTSTDKKLPVAAGKPWSTELDAQLLQLSKSGETEKQIADKLGRSRYAIFKRLEKLAENKTKSADVKETPNLEKELLELSRAGKTPEEITNVIMKRLDKFKSQPVAPPPPPPPPDPQTIGPQDTTFSNLPPPPPPSYDEAMSLKSDEKQLINPIGRDGAFAFTKSKYDVKSNVKAELNDDDDDKDVEEADFKLGSDQEKVLKCVAAGGNVFVSGGAGTGKSYLLRRIVKLLPKQTTYVTASTGLAASNIGGITIHSFSGIGLGKDPVGTLIEQIRKRQVYRSRWIKATTLIIDEISMLSSDIWDKLEEIARKIRGIDKPFGNIQLIICGDFLQLPPILESKRVSKDEIPNLPFCFLATSWATCMDTQISLQQVYRQADSSFVELLDELRYGKPSNKSVAQLKKCLGHKQRANNGVVATRLYAKRDSVDAENQKQLDLINEPPHIFVAKNSGKPGALDLCNAQNKLVLKKGAQVVLLKNLDVPKGLVNGSRGVVLNIQKSTKHPGLLSPFVQFANGITKLIEREKWDMKSGDKIIATRKQIPLGLAWAMTIHKSQGMTLDRAEISIAECFEYGQAYVALSRIRSLEGLTLLSFDQHKIKAHPKVVEYYVQLRNKDASDVKDLKSDDAKKRSPPLTPPSAVKRPKTNDEEEFEREMEIMQSIDTNYANPFQD